MRRICVSIMAIWIFILSSCAVPNELKPLLGKWILAYTHCNGLFSEEMVLEYYDSNDNCLVGNEGEYNYWGCENKFGEYEQFDFVLASYNENMFQKITHEYYGNLVDDNYIEGIVVVEVKGTLGYTGVYPFFGCKQE